MTRREVVGHWPPAGPRRLPLPPTWRDSGERVEWIPTPDGGVVVVNVTPDKPHAHD